VRLILVDHNLGPTGGINLRLRFSESSLSALLEMEPLIVEAPTLEGAFQVENLAIAMTLCHSLGYSWHSLVPLAKVLTPVPGRMENVTPPHLRSKAPNVFVDYAHTADALESALRSLRTLAHGKDILITTVFGCGGGRDRTKRPAMAAVAAAFSDRVIVTTDNSRYEDPAAIIAEVAAGFPQKTDWTSIVDRAVAIECAITSGAPGHFVLVAGKGHEDYQIIGETKLPFSDAATARRVLEKIFPAEDLEGGGA
jgi:UDP-N-acetylmuramoyl-L-alanyl-D-glutamate--2,6-diaminopimelate ligase